MPEYRRNFVNGGTYFFTVVTYNRQPFLTTEGARNCLHNAWEDVQVRFPFVTVAVSLLPEHVHCLWRLPEGDSNYSIRWKEIKRLFSKNYPIQDMPGETISESRLKRGEKLIWQRRFWEHTIRDENDLRNHMEYIHYNPVKHGLVQRAWDWPWSSFHRYVKMGLYEKDWGEAADMQFNNEYGE